MHCYLVYERGKKNIHSVQLVSQRNCEKHLVL